MAAPLNITERPRDWDHIVGQDRAVRILRKMFSQTRSRPKGLIFEGPTGVGKTTTARIAARSFLCSDQTNPGCGKCESCLTFDARAEHHPDLTAVDAASNSGVDAARIITGLAQELPALGNRRVIIVDEAHRLSREAWDVYLAPLEDRDSRCVFLFCTTEPHRIPRTIRGRCACLPFPKVSSEAMLGLLVALCTQNNIDYELDGLRSVVRAAKGHVRDAVLLTDTVATLGAVTKEAVLSTADLTLSDSALEVWIHLAAGRTTEAYRCLDSMARGWGATRAIEEMFTIYGRANVGSDPDTTVEEARRFEAIRARFCDVAATTAILLRWSTPERIPADALVLFGHDLAQVVVIPTPNTKPAAGPSLPRETPSVPRIQVPDSASDSGRRTASVEAAARILDATVTRG